MKFLSKVKRVTATSDDMKFEADFPFEAYGDLPEIRGAYSVLHDTKVNLKYQIDMDVRNWGIQSIYVTVPDQEIKFRVEMDEGEEAEVKDVTFKVTKANVVLEMKSDGDKNHVSFMPHELTIHKGKVFVRFTL